MVLTGFELNFSIYIPKKNINLTYIPFNNIYNSRFLIGKFKKVIKPKYNIEVEMLDNGIGVLITRFYHLKIFKIPQINEDHRTSVSTTVENNSTWNINFISYDQSMFRDYDFKGDFSFFDFV